MIPSTVMWGSNLNVADLEQAENLDFFADMRMGSLGLIYAYPLMYLISTSGGFILLPVLTDSDILSQQLFS